MEVRSEVVVMRFPGGAAVTASELAAVLRGPRIGSVAEVGAVLVTGCPPLLMLLDLVLSVRVFQRPSRLRTVYTVLAALRLGRVARRETVAQQQVFGLYCTLRRAAVPSAGAGATLCTVGSLSGCGVVAVGWFLHGDMSVGEGVGNEGVIGRCTCGHWEISYSHLRINIFQKGGKIPPYRNDF